MLCLAFGLASVTAWPAQAHLRAGPVRLAIPATPPRAAAAEPAAAEPVEASVIRLQDLAPDEARRWNAAHSIATAANPPARPFQLAAEGIFPDRQPGSPDGSDEFRTAWIRDPDGGGVGKSGRRHSLVHQLDAGRAAGVVCRAGTRTRRCATRRARRRSWTRGRTATRNGRGWWTSRRTART